MTTRQELIFDRRSHSFRSAGIFLFLDALKHEAGRKGSKGWTTLAAMKHALPGQGPRQFARYVDMLATAGLSLVEYETKTRGRWRLAVPPGALDLRLGNARTNAAAAVWPASAAHSLAVLSDPAWVEWALLLAQGNMAIHDGYLESAEQAFRDAEQTAANLPPWAASVAHARIAHLLLRQARYRDAAACLRRLDTLCRQGLAANSVTAALPLLQAKFHYDRGRLQDAEQALARSTATAESDDPYALNMRALIAGRRYWQAPRANAGDDLALALEKWLRAFGAIAVRGETMLLDAICYNLANNMLRGVARRSLPTTSADTALRWLAMNLFLCRKLGLGGDSILVYLLLMDTWLEHGLSPQDWPATLRDDLNLPQSPKGVLAAALNEARATRMPLELALCLKRQMLLADSNDAAREAFDEAETLLKGIGQRDELRKLRAAWRSRRHPGGNG